MRGIILDIILCRERCASQTAVENDRVQPSFSAQKNIRKLKGIQSYWQFPFDYEPNGMQFVQTNSVYKFSFVQTNTPGLFKKITSNRRLGTFPAQKCDGRSLNLERECSVYMRRHFLPNWIKSNPNTIVFTMHRFISNQTDSV